MNGSPFTENGLIGFFTLIIQIAALCVSQSEEFKYIPDLVCTGIWGGVYLIMFDALAKNKKLCFVAIRWMAVYAICIGFTLIGINSWSIALYQPLIADCEYVMFFRIGLCGRVAIDCLMITCGVVAVLLNGLIFAKASSLASS